MPGSASPFHGGQRRLGLQRIPEGIFAVVDIEYPTHHRRSQPSCSPSRPSDRAVPRVTRALARASAAQVSAVQSPQGGWLSDGALRVQVTPTRTDALSHPPTPQTLAGGIRFPNSCSWRRRRRRRRGTGEGQGERELLRGRDRDRDRDMQGGKGGGGGGGGGPA